MTTKKMPPAKRGILIDGGGKKKLHSPSQYTLQISALSSIPKCRLLRQEAGQ